MRPFYSMPWHEMLDKLSEYVESPFVSADEFSKYDCERLRNAARSIELRMEEHEERHGPGKKPVAVSVNGSDVSIARDGLSFEDIAKLAPGANTVTYYYKGSGSRGILHRGETLQVRPGLIIDAMDTSNA